LYVKINLVDKKTLLICVLLNSINMTAQQKNVTYLKGECYVQNWNRRQRIFRKTFGWLL